MYLALTEFLKEKAYTESSLTELIMGEEQGCRPQKMDLQLYLEHVKLN